VIDPSREWEVGGFRSLSVNSPWKGQTMRGRVVSTIFEGRQVHQLVAS
jgi:dihydroorotase-like cyclic amidohydrolase